MPSIRTFVAVPLNDPQRRTLATLIGLLRGKTDQSVRWVDPSQLHITLVFLGDLPSERIPDVCRVSQEVCQNHAPISWNLHGLGAFPTIDRAAILWAGVDDPAGGFARLHGEIEDRLVEFGCRREERVFRPHVTIGRVARGRRLPPHVRSDFTPDWAGPAALTDSIDVMSSVLGPSGPEYAVLARCAFGGGDCAGSANRGKQ